MFDFRDGGRRRASSVGPFRLTTAQMAHPVACFGVRIEAGGRTLVYTGDTGPTEALVDLARGADVLLAEASFSTATPTRRASTSPAGRPASTPREAGVGRLLVTHVPPWHRLDRTLGRGGRQLRRRRRAAEPAPSSSCDGVAVRTACPSRRPG